VIEAMLRCVPVISRKDPVVSRKGNTRHVEHRSHPAV
jgi:hypothetical protein